MAAVNGDGSKINYVAGKTWDDYRRDWPHLEPDPARINRTASSRPSSR